MSDKLVEKSVKVASRVRSRVSSSVLWALIFTLLIAVWMATGEIKGGSALKEEAPSLAEKADKKQQAEALFKVRTAVFSPVKHPETLTIRGRTLTENQVEVLAETAGLITALPANKGDLVEKGAVLCELEDGGRKASVLEAQALVAQAEADFNASKTLEKRGHIAGLKVLENKALYNRALATLERAELDLQRSKIVAPFAGFIDKQPAKVGSFLAVGGNCATLVALDPLLVIGAVRERDVGKLKTGMAGTAKLVTGETAQGTIEFISARAENETRTFRIDLSIPNPSGALKSGVTADIEIPLEPRDAIKLPPSLLTLNDEGKVGVRVVNGEGHIEFWPVKILSEEMSGVWVEALPTNSNIITVGQDFVKAGQKVEQISDPNYSGKPGS